MGWESCHVAAAQCVLIVTFLVEGRRLRISHRIKFFRRQQRENGRTDALALALLVLALVFIDGSDALR